MLHDRFHGKYADDLGQAAATHMQRIREHVTIKRRTKIPFRETCASTSPICGFDRRDDIAVVIALGRLTAPHWPLAVTALVFSVLLFVGEIVDNYQVVQPRYVIAPALLLYTAIVAMLRPRGLAHDASSAGEPNGVPSGDAFAGAASRGQLPVVAAWTPVTVFALLLTVVIGFNYRVVNNRSESPPWTAVVAAARQSCMKPGMADYEYSHLWWHVRIACSRV